jgi:hypothetical protein
MYHYPCAAGAGTFQNFRHFFGFCLEYINQRCKFPTDNSFNLLSMCLFKITHANSLSAFSFINSSYYTILVIQITLLCVFAGKCVINNFVEINSKKLFPQKFNSLSNKKFKSHGSMCLPLPVTMRSIKIGRLCPSLPGQNKQDHISRITRE